jgi:hypothetical protein
MVKHIVLYFLKDKSEESKNALKAKFMSMQGKIDCLKSIEVGIDFMHSDRSADVSLECTFNTKEDLATYAEHPVHVPVKEYVKSVVEKSVSCDYEIKG